jgi:exodeoxyribonuclease VII large subunit
LFGSHFSRVLCVAGLFIDLKCIYGSKLNLHLRMPEKANEKIIFSLLEVTQSIQKTLAERYTSSFWVKAEMNKLNNYPHSGHCYPDLVEKKDERVVAQLKATLWKEDYLRINSHFQQVLKEPLKDGIKILFCATITFDPAHGLSLRILDIDPSYSLGELEKEKSESISRITGEGIFYRNKKHQPPLLPQRIAIISVQTSKGYSDFMRVIEGNQWGYKFFLLLFPALLQGDSAAPSIIRQLKRIEKVKSHFDMVAIIRGGGGEVGLSCYNNFSLAREVALFPLPVITGIGHSTNETVVEMVAFENAITPTKLAEFLLQRFHNFSVPVKRAEERLADRSLKILKDEKSTFHNAVKYFRSVTGNMLATGKHAIKIQSGTLLQQSTFLLRRERESYVSMVNGIKKRTLSFCNNTHQEIRLIALQLKKDVVTNLNRHELLVMQNLQQVERGSRVLFLSGRMEVQHHNEKLFEETAFFMKTNAKEMTAIERSIINMNPENVLRRGYSITLLNGKALKSIEQVNPGDIVETLLINGNISSTVLTTKKEIHHE